MLRRQLLAAALGAGLLLAPLGAALAWEGEVESLKQRWEQITTQRAEGQRRDSLKSSPTRRSGWSRPIPTRRSR